MTQIGDYRLIRRIGAGGMAEVWIGERDHMGITKTVAVKLLLPHCAQSEEHRRMFFDEARLSMLLRNSAIVQVFDFGEQNAECYMIMEWIDGINVNQLDSALWTQGQILPLHITTYVIAEVLRALHHAHNLHHGMSEAIVHRDVSPQNVMLSSAGEVKLMDFGVARFANEATSGLYVKGKLRYMPPEQLSGQSGNPSVDLFAVGAMFQEMVEGRKFRCEVGENESDLLGAVLRGDVPALPPSIELPPELEAFRVGLLAPALDVRTSSALEALELLTSWPGYRNAAIDLGRHVERFREFIPKTNYAGGSDSRSASAVRSSRSSSSASSISSSRPSASSSAPKAPLEAGETSVSRRLGGGNPGTNSRLRTPAARPRPKPREQQHRSLSQRQLVAMPLFVSAITVALATIPLAMAQGPADELTPRDEQAPLDLTGSQVQSPPAPFEEPPTEPEDPPLVEASGSEDTGSEDTGSEDTGSEDTGSEDTGSEDTGSEDTGGLIIFDDDGPDDESDDPPVKPQTVSVVIKANDYFYAYVKIGGKRVTVEPVKKIRLSPGRYAVKMRQKKSAPWVKAGSVTIEPGKNYTLLMTKAAGERPGVRVITN
ncbi:serine/threonine protein kinase [Pseudenhygromyxa sp. WMMC2535]|uniref:serine/threonine protein kinase n=1 Tax=Pseudenhygromyxa sp. WMMC2535 TaxID=2712867 RepID=UPI001552A45E|nr:serine/threonine-protein kinase [Pseudenhygromyxa sp. WMMC2535]NVB39622.1 serine/threonine protein kinase [Pseudenhygromyxa sp. WMMC2535]